MERFKVFRIVCLLYLFVPHVSVAQTFTHASSPYRAQVPAASMRSTSSMRGSAASYSGAGVSRSTYGTAGTMRTGGSYSAASASYGGTNVYRPNANVQGFYTAATSVRGGVTAADTYSPSSAPRRVGIMPPPPDPEDEESWCEHCVDVNGDGKCDRCGCELGGTEGCHCDPCQCPVGDGWDVWILLAVMAISYVLFMRRRNEKMQNNLHN